MRIRVLCLFFLVKHENFAVCCVFFSVFLVCCCFVVLFYLACNNFCCSLFTFTPMVSFILYIFMYMGKLFRYLQCYNTVAEPGLLCMRFRYVRWINIPVWSLFFLFFTVFLPSFLTLFLCWILKEEKTILAE